MQYRIEDVFNEIQRSNRRKLGTDGKPIYRENGNVLKVSGFSKTDFSRIWNKKNG